MSDIKHLLDNNINWAKSVKEENENFFSELAKEQHPDFLWIGCSDSRVPATQVVQVKPGEVFVHRNIANVVSLSDENCLSVIHYAVGALKVKHIIVCGHYNCGGVKASLEDVDHGFIDKWLSNVKEVITEHKNELDQLDDDAKVSRLCELNVLAQVKNVIATDPVQDAWANGQELSVHGWIYNLADGLLTDLDTTHSGN